MKAWRGSGDESGPVYLIAGDGSFVDVRFHGMSLADWITAGRLNLGTLNGLTTAELTLLVSQVRVVEPNRLGSPQEALRSALAAQVSFMEAIQRLVRHPGVTPDVIDPLRDSFIDIANVLNATTD